MTFKKINNSQWLSDCNNYGIQKVAINDNATRFQYDLCEVNESYGCLQFEATETYDRLKDAKRSQIN